MLGLLKRPPPHFRPHNASVAPQLRVAGPTSKAKARPKRGCASAPNSDCMPFWSVRQGSANPHLSAQPTPCFLRTALSPSPFSRRTLPAAWAGCSGLGDGVRPCQVHGHRLTAACYFSMNSRNGPGLQENPCGTSWTPAPFICTGRKCGGGRLSKPSNSERCRPSCTGKGAWA